MHAKLHHRACAITQIKQNVKMQNLTLSKSLTPIVSQSMYKPLNPPNQSFTRGGREGGHPFPEDYRNGLQWIPPDLSTLSNLQYHPVLPQKQGLVRHDEDY